MEKRYNKNIDDIFTINLQDLLLTKTVSVIGCGGQGSYILEFLVRLGVKTIYFWDGDYYEESNLNRQLGSTEKVLGKNKAQILFKYLKEINSTVNLLYYDWFFGEEESEDLKIVLESDFIFYCADCYVNVNIMRNLLRQAICAGIPLIDCPVQKLGGYIFIETSQGLEHYDFVTEKLKQQIDNVQCSQPAYKCAAIASEAVNQMVQYFSNSRYAAINTELIVDLYHHKYIERDKYSLW